MESSPQFTHVAPVRPLAGYIGGKRNLARRIVALIERIPHSSYAEPFVGMGGIFLRRRLAPRAEAINDISGDVVTLFRVLQEHYPYFIDMMRFRLASRGEFERLVAIPPERLTDLQRAARFLYLQRLAFGGKVSGRNFGVSAGEPSGFNVTTLEPMLADVHARLAGVTIERLHFGEFIRRYDRPGALFYCDPPYWSNERDYGDCVFARDDFTRLAEQLRGLKGSFLLSLNDAPGVRACFAGFAIAEVETSWTIGAKARRASELLIGNLPVELLATTA